MKLALFLCTAYLVLSPISATATIGLEVTPGSWDIGAVPEGSVQTTWTASTPGQGGYFLVTHIGTDPVEAVSIRCENTTDWINGISQGPDVFTLGWGQTGVMGTMPAFSRIHVTNTVMLESLAVSSSFGFDLELGLPLPSSTTNVQQTTVTLTASSPVGYLYSMTGDFWAKNIGNGAYSDDWSGPTNHVISETEWEALVLDGIIQPSTKGWAPGTSMPCYNIYAWLWFSEDVGAGFWNYECGGKAANHPRWVVLD